ncbi:hypothetical protein ZIOFF_069809 [Zingiber officinale]|uniref:Protein kinase domain-containing protein n=1 Tax=Zingiber officinale TaxID=94328 RepID=A0A8J5CBQ6_ZINOF|nr:hypothetical protein ZIOFF_069809 [Zingiber officinale]
MVDWSMRRLDNCMQGHMPEELLLHNLHQGQHQCDHSGTTVSNVSLGCHCDLPLEKKVDEKQQDERVRKTLNISSTPTSLTFCGLFSTENNADEEEAMEEENLDMPLFDLGRIAKANGDFCFDNKLGEGGFGHAYKEKLEGQEIAVKRIGGHNKNQWKIRIFEED